MINWESIKSIGSMFFKKGGNFKLWLAIVAFSGPLALAADGHTINAHMKDSTITITPPANSITYDEDTEQEESTDKASVEGDTSE